MIDPISALATATAVFNGIKKAVEIGKDAEDIFQQLGRWAGAVSDLQEWMGQESKRPPLFKTLSFSKSVDAEAFDEFAAKKRIQQWERELYDMFLYGDLAHLGMDGYRELIQLRRDIKTKREKLVYEQQRRRRAFVDGVITWTLASLIIFVGVLILWAMVAYIAKHAPKNVFHDERQNFLALIRKEEFPQ